METAPAVDPQYEEPYVYRHTFASGGCCCKRQVYFEYIMPKRVFVSGEDIEGRMVIDNINDERVAYDVSLIVNFVSIPRFRFNTASLKER